VRKNLHHIEDDTETNRKDDLFTKVIRFIKKIPKTLYKNRKLIAGKYLKAKPKDD